MKRLFVSLFVLCALVLPVVSFAQSTEEVRATVTSVVVDEEVEGIRHVVFTARDTDGDVHTVDSADSYLEGIQYEIRTGQDVLLQVVTPASGEELVFLVDIVRFGSLMWVLGLFAALVLIVGMMRGARALLGLGVTLVVLFGGILPGILAGMSPVLVTVLGGVVILAVNIHLTHGLRRSSFFAFLATAGGLILVWFFSSAFVWFSQLSGIASEEASLLFLTVEIIRSPRGLLLAGIILGAVGVLDDIAITQSETVSELYASNPKLSRRALFDRAMNVGRHHIASVVNTLVLAYAGVAMPLFLLFYLRDDISVWRFMNEELVAEELIRTLAGTVGLVLLVPLATALAVYAVHGHEHEHSH